MAQKTARVRQAIAQLPAKKRAAVEAWLRIGDWYEAALKGGYGPDHHAVRMAAWRLQRDPRVKTILELIREEHEGASVAIVEEYRERTRTAAEQAGVHPLATRAGRLNWLYRFVHGEIKDKSYRKDGSVHEKTPNAIARVKALELLTRMCGDLEAQRDDDNAQIVIAHVDNGRGPVPQGEIVDALPAPGESE